MSTWKLPPPGYGLLFLVGLFFCLFDFFLPPFLCITNTKYQASVVEEYIYKNSFKFLISEFFF